MHPPAACVCDEFCIHLIRQRALLLPEAAFSGSVSVGLGPTVVDLIDPVSVGLNPCCDAKLALRKTLKGVSK